MVLNYNPMAIFYNLFYTEIDMVHLSTKLSFDIKLELSRVKETARTISKVLRVSKETVRTRLRKLT